MQSRSNMNVDRLLGRGPFAREGGPEPTIIPHLALSAPQASLDRLCDLARLFGRGECPPQVPWPDLENATVSAVVSRLALFPDVEPLLKEHAAVATFLPDSMLRSAIDTAFGFDDQDKYRSIERMARLIARKADLAGNETLDPLPDAFRSLSPWEAAGTLPWLAIASQGEERDALVAQLAELEQFDVAGLSALLPHLSDDDQTTLVDRILQPTMAIGDAAVSLGSLTHLLPFARGQAGEALLERISWSATRLVKDGQWLPDWLLALVVSRLAHLPIKRAGTIAGLLSKTLPAPWSEQVASRFASSDIDFPFADVLLVQPGSEYLVDNKDGIAGLDAETDDTLHSIIMRWGGAPPAGSATATAATAATATTATTATTAATAATTATTATATG